MCVWAHWSEWGGSKGFKWRSRLEIRLASYCDCHFLKVFLNFGLEAKDGRCDLRMGVKGDEGTNKMAEWAGGAEVSPMVSWLGLKDIITS